MNILISSYWKLMCVNCENEWVPRVQVINPTISQSIPENRSAKLQLTKSTYPTLNLTKLTETFECNSTNLD